MQRRTFLLGGAVAAAPVGAVYCSKRNSAQSSTPVGTGHFVSSGGLLDAAINAGYGWVDLAGRRALLYSFNGRVPGPLLEVKPGDIIRLRLNNRLPEPTNVHYHGLHVSPAGHADNIFLRIPSGESLQYEFTLHRDHPAGLFWYHPHLHGLVAKQVSMGLAAPLVIRGALDAIPEVAAAREFFLALQDFELDSSGRTVAAPMPEQMHGREGSLITVSGKLRPRFPIQQNGLLRLRFLNASTSRFYRLKVEDHPMHVIATDGGSIPSPQSSDELLLAPGQRVDVLIRGERDNGSYRILNLPYDRGSMEMMGGGMMGRGGMMRGMGQTSGPGAIASIMYQGRSERNWNVPARLVDVSGLPPPSAPLRTFELGMGMMMGHGMSFTIDGRTFSADRIDTAVHLNSVEDWEYANPTMMDHPMHLHINAFQILDAQGQPERAWRDVVVVKAKSSARFRVRFMEFPGKTVHHCHILDHEDLGMMSTVQMNE